MARTVLIKVGSIPADPSTPMPMANAAASAPASMSAAAGPPASAPAEGSDEAKAQAAFAIVSRHLGRAGAYRTPTVYTVTVPRDDLTLLIEGMEVPVAAGVESVFHFYHCPCGKTNVVGQFCVLDYEANDVIDALRSARIEIASVAPMLLHTRQAPVLIRFFAEGQPEPIAKAIREGLRWTGKERAPPAIPLINEPRP